MFALVESGAAVVTCFVGLAVTDAALRAAAGGNGLWMGN